MISILILLASVQFVFANDVAPLDLSTLSQFKDGVTLEYKPLQFKSKFRFRVQNRFTYETEESTKFKAKQVDFAVRRMRLRYEGNVLDSRLLFKFQFSFTRGDMDFDRTNYPNILRDAVVGWKLSDKTTFWYGQTKLPGNRQRVVSSGSQQFVDRSLLNATFNIDRDLGAQLYHQIGDEKPFWVKLAVSNGEGRATENKDNGLAYTSRVEWLPLGNFKDEGDYFESDLSREDAPKISIGAVYSVNKKTTRNGGQLGRQFTTVGLNKDMETWFGDFLLKYRGYSFSTEYAKRTTDSPFFKDGSTNVTIYEGEAINAQMGYLFDNNIEPAIRFTKLWAHGGARAGENDRTQYTVGLSKYINHHKVKFQTDMSFDEQTNPLKKSYQSSWIYRAQMEIGI
ncbi:MAG: porin [Bacteriovoracaceae bacterium]